MDHFSDGVSGAMGRRQRRTGIAAVRNNTCQPPACRHILSNNVGLFFELGKAGSVATPLAHFFNSNSQYWLSIFLAAFTMKS
jgi:hypothetical protein